MANMLQSTLKHQVFGLTSKKNYPQNAYHVLKKPRSAHRKKFYQRFPFNIPIYEKCLKRSIDNKQARTTITFQLNSENVNCCITSSSIPIFIDTFFYEDNDHHIFKWISLWNVTTINIQTIHIWDEVILYLWWLHIFVVVAFIILCRYVRCCCCWKKIE